MPRDPVRITLEYMMSCGIGRRNAIPLRRIVAYLNRRGVRVSETGFQQTILAESRSGNYFIGSDRRGYFLIDSVQDAEEMRDFYRTRIRREQENLANLARQARAIGWNI